MHNETISIESAKSKGELDQGTDAQDVARAKQRNPNKQLPKIKCQICRTSCSNRSNLTRHMRRHTIGAESAVAVAEKNRSRNMVSNTRSTTTCSTRTTRSQFGSLISNKSQANKDAEDLYDGRSIVENKSEKSDVSSTEVSDYFESHTE